MRPHWFIFQMENWNILLCGTTFCGIIYMYIIFLLALYNLGI